MVGRTAGGRPRAERPAFGGLRHSSHAAWIILVLSLVLTVLAWYIADNAVRTRAGERFEFQSQDVTRAITRRMDEYAMALRGGIALMQSSDRATRSTWRTFTEVLDLQSHFPGIQGLGYSVMLRPDELAEHVAAVRAEGFPDYDVRPAGARPAYSAIVFLEPFDWRNQRAFGYDMYSEPTRRAAMEHARDSGEPAVSGRVTLVQETDEDPQYGFLMYYPHYAAGPQGSVEARRAALRGFVYSPFRMGDLMHGILGADQGALDFAIYDGAEPRADAILYNNTGGDELRYLAADDTPEFSGLYQIAVGGHTWTLHLYSRPDYLSGAEKSQPAIVAIGGLIVDILLFLVIANLSRQRRRAEELAGEMTEELAASEQRYRRLFRDAKAVMLLSDPESGQIVDANAAAAAFYGFAAEALCAKRIAELCPLPAAEFADLAAAGRGELRVPQRLASGELRQVELRRGEIEVDGRPMTLSIIFDVSERQRAEAALEASERRYRAVFDLSPVPMFLVDRADGAILEFNAAASARYGFSRAEFLAMSLGDLRIDQRAPALAEEVAALEGARAKFDARHRTHDGGEIVVEVNVQPFVYGDREVRIAAVTDITERARAAAAMAEARAAAEAASRAKSEFVANMSHELRTPMNAILGLGQLLVELELADPAGDYAARIFGSSQAMLALLNDILDHSKIEANRVVLERRSFALRDVVERSTGLFIERAEAKGVALRVVLADDLPAVVLGDALRLGQVLNNLLGNAVKFTARGQIELRVDRVAADDDGDLILRFAVRDSGIGVAKEALEKLFEPFHQEDASTTRRFGGTGLGLSISRALVQLMGGEITARSELGWGSEFSFTARFAVAAGADATPSEATNGGAITAAVPWYVRGARLRGARVLIVEDNQTNQMVAQALLDRLGVISVVADDGAEGLRRLASERVDLVLMDLQMPVMDGLEATR
ncbi:MAG: CHASE domain-containing protein, partial [Myxococcales bacterium]|nr:CHASE domain-containing protein [Myxococcales bacterium]